MNTGIIKPALTAIIFIYLYPIISKHFYGYWLKKNLELKKLRDEIEKATLLTREESYAIRMEMIKSGEKYEETIRRQAAEIQALKNNPANPETEAYRNEADKLRTEVEKLRGRAGLEDKAQSDRKKIVAEIRNLINQGAGFLSQAQASPRHLDGQSISEIQSWVARVGKILRMQYGAESPEFSDYTNLISEQDFYELHSNNYTQLARMLGIAKSILRDLEQTP